MPEPTVMAVIALTVLVGSFMQGVTGFGVGAVVAPVAMLLRPDLMPVLVLALGGCFAIATTLTEWRSIRMSDVWYAMLGRMPGMALGVSVVALMPVAVLEVVVAGCVLSAVVMTGRAPERAMAPTRSRIVIAGAGSGFTGTAAGIGGPPMALAYQHVEAPRLRGTLGAFFAMGTAVSLVSLAGAGQVELRILAVAAALLPLLAGGFVLAYLTRSRVPRHRLGLFVRALVTVAAVSLLGRAIF